MLAIVPYYQNLNPIKKITLSIKSKPVNIYQKESASIKKIFQNLIDNTAV